MRKFLLTQFLLCLFAIPLFAQDRVITGKITSSEDGSLLPGVNISVKGTTRGTTTDANGAYSLSVPADAKALVYSFIGFTRQEIVIGSQSVVNLRLLPDASQLDEVVVTALGVARQEKELGYGTARLDNKDVTQARALNAASALSGKVSGLQISTTNNGVNPNVRVVLRGNRSLLGNNQALIVIDGSTVSNDALNYLNPNDIDNVTVLKGANAAALYGSDASNGALIITTKKGSAGAPKITVSNTTQAESISFMPSFQQRFGSGTESFSRVYIPFENQSYGPEFDGSQQEIGLPLEDGTTQMTTYDYKKNAKRGSYDTGLTIQNNVSLSAGTEKSQVYISVQNNTTKGILPGDTYKNNNVRLNASQQYGKIQAGFNVAYAQTVLDRTSSGNFYNEVLNTPGQIPLDTYRNWNALKKADGSLNYANPNNYYNAYFYNPFFTKDVNRYGLTNGNLTGNVQVQYTVTPWLSVLGRVGLNRNDLNGKAFQEKFAYGSYAKSVGDFSEAQNDLGGNVSDISGFENRLNTDLFATVKKNFGAFSTNLIVGINNKENSARFASTTANALIVPGLYNVSNRSGEAVVSEVGFKSRLTGVFGDLTLGYNDYLFVHVSGRNDQTSLLSKANRSFFYPGADISFVASDAIPALKNNGTLSYLKFRASATKVGQVNVNPYALQTIFSTGIGALGANFPFGSLAGYSTGNTFANPDLRPEFTTSYEVGADLGFLNGRVNLELAYYTQKTNNQTLQISTSQATGFGFAFVNAGTVQNTGFEVDLKTTPVRTASGLRWDLNMNYSQVDNKVLDLYGGSKELNLSNYYGLTSDASLGQVFATVGQQYPSLKVVAMKRVPNADGTYNPNGAVVVNSETGLPSTSPQGLKTVGQTNPKYRLGLNTTIKYRGLSLSGTAEYRGGYFIYHGLGSTAWFTGVAEATAVYGRERFVFPNSVLETVGADGKSVYTPNTSVTVKDGGLGSWDSNLRKYGEMFTTSGAFWKLRELALTYEFPKSLLGNTKFLKGASIGFVGRNLLTFLPKENKYTDPEFSNAAPGVGANQNQNIGNAAGLNATALTPPTRTYGFQINLNL